MVALTQSSFTNFNVEIQSMENFNLASILQNSVLVLYTFLVLWLGLPVIVMLVSFVRSCQITIATRKDSSDNVAMVGQLADSYLKSFFETVEAGVEDKLSEIPIARVFSFTSGGLLRKNRYLVLLRILTNICFGMFMLAFFYNMQIPTDDGTCSLHKDLASCLFSKSYFDSQCSSCDWINTTTATVKIAAFNCQWAQPQVSIYVFVLFTVFVVVISAPVQLLLDWIFDSVIFAPSRPLWEDETVKRIRRATIAAVNTMATVVTNKKFVFFTSTVEMAEEVTLTRKTLLKSVERDALSACCVETIRSLFVQSCSLSMLLLILI